jgi:hypothetical protein
MGAAFAAQQEVVGRGLVKPQRTDGAGRGAKFGWAPAVGCAVFW